jgi:hypothetical protein
MNFTPQSPDPYLKNESDMHLAKFGHINALSKQVGNYKSYVALLTQANLDNPEAVVLKNDLGGDVVWSRSGAGDYLATLVGSFPNNKVVIFIGSGFNNNNTSFAYIVAKRYDNDSVAVYTGSAVSTLADGRLSNTPIEIRVYE